MLLGPRLAIPVPSGIHVYRITTTLYNSQSTAKVAIGIMLTLRRWDLASVPLAFNLQSQETMACI